MRPGIRAQPFALSPRLRGLCALTRCIPHAQTCNFDTLYAYLSTANYDFSYDRAKNLCDDARTASNHHRPVTHALTRFLAARSRPKRNIKTAMNNEIMLYGIAQKEQLGAHTPLVLA